MRARAPPVSPSAVRLRGHGLIGLPPLPVPTDLPGDLVDEAADAHGAPHRGTNLGGWGGGEPVGVHNRPRGTELGFFLRSGRGVLGD